MLKKITAAYTLALMGLVVVLGSCKKEYEPIETSDDAVIQQYIKSNNITATKDSTGFYYQVVSQGDSGVFYKNTDSVLYVVSMKSLKNGTVYYANPSNSNLGTFVGYANRLGLIDATGAILFDDQQQPQQIMIDVKAIRAAILALKPGGVARVFVPSYQAFGRNGFAKYNVPSNEVMDVMVTTIPDKSQAALDDRLIREFIAAKAITGLAKTPTGVYYSISAPGSGAEVINAGSAVTANYAGRTLDGVTFQSTTDSTFTLPVNQFIQGWTEILPLVKKGGKLRMLIPSAMAYGTTGTQTGTLKNTVLDFDVEVVDVKN